MACMQSSGWRNQKGGCDDEKKKQPAETSGAPNLLWHVFGLICCWYLTGGVKNEGIEMGDFDDISMISPNGR